MKLALWGYIQSLIYVQMCRNIYALPLLEIRLVGYRTVPLISDFLLAINFDVTKAFQ